MNVCTMAIFPIAAEAFHSKPHAVCHRPDDTRGKVSTGFVIWGPRMPLQNVIFHPIVVEIYLDENDGASDQLTDRWTFPSIEQG